MTEVHRKTYKREMAVALGAVWLGISIWIFFGLPPAHIENYEGVYGTFTWVAWLYIGWAMGMQVFQNVAAAKLGKG